MLPNQRISRTLLAAAGGFTLVAALTMAPSARADSHRPSATTAEQLANSANLATPHLQLGDRGTAVRHLQQLLVANDFLDGDVTGIFDRTTQTAVRELQAFADLAVDGVAGTTTWDALIRMTDPYNVNLTPAS